MRRRLLNDTDGDGNCDEFEIAGCTDPAAANYDPFATDDDASCLEPICIDPEACNYTEWSGNDYCLIVQPYQVHDGGDLDGYVTYRVYIKTQNSDDFISSVTGDSEFPTRIQSSGDFYQSAFGGLLGSDQNPALFAFFPEGRLRLLRHHRPYRRSRSREKETSTPLNRRSTRGAPTSKTDKTSSSMTPSEVDGSSSTETPTVWPVTTSRYSLHKSPPTACSPVPFTFRYSSTEIRTPTTASSDLGRRMRSAEDPKCVSSQKPDTTAMATAWRMPTATVYATNLKWLDVPTQLPVTMTLKQPTTTVVLATR